MNKIVDILYKYANMNNDEWAESATALCQIWYERSSFSEQFVQVLEKEIQDFLTYCEEHATIKTEKKLIH
jgi:hypothetical protein